MPTTVTKTIKSAGGDYTSLSAWEAANQGDLVAADELRQAECYGMNDSTACTIDGSTTDATRYLRVFPATGAEAQLPYDTSGVAYRRDIAGGNLTVSDLFTRVERIQLSISGTSSGDIVSVEVNNVQLLGCLFRSTSSGSPRLVAVKSGVTGVFHLRNCVGIGGGLGMGINIGSSGGGSTSYIYNCTVVGCGTNFNRSGSGVALAINCLGSGGTTADFGGSWSAAGSTNATSDATAPGSSARTSQTFTFVNAAGGDYHLASGDAGAKDFGTDLSGDATFPFSDDFDGVARSGTWDIGADEFVAAGGGTAISATIAGSATGSTMHLTARRAHALTVPATSNKVANLAARRAMSLTPAAVSTVVVVANVRRVQIATVSALSTVTWAQHARRDVRQTSTGVSAVSVTLDRITADNAIAVTITALSAMVAQMNARRSLQLAAAASSSVSSEIAARRALLAIFAPQSAVTVDLDGTSAASASTGKYQREHDAALIDLAASTGFSSEHRSALSDLLDAGG